MSGLDDILRSLPMDQLARQLGVDEATASQAAGLALPALLGGLQANAADESGASSILDALSQHDGSVFDQGVDFERVDTADGEKISQHIFGSNQDEVVQRLGGAGGGAIGGQLIRRLLPLLAPLVLSYLAGRMGGGSRGGTTGGGATGPSLPTGGGSREAGAPGSLQDMLGEVLGGAAGGSAAEAGRQNSQQSSGGNILTDLLGGLLGGGRR
ncbi:MAG: DUF937 domain-containing protein [Actinomycetia bacterium]|nr:DUF937 domain-containing protein [Actinomycetes bacterium]MDO5502849.1 DUF937 domain-containing protein [Actinomycetes bacterium]